MHLLRESKRLHSSPVLVWFICLEDMLSLIEQSRPERNMHKHDGKQTISGKERADFDRNVHKREEKRLLTRGTLLQFFLYRKIT